MRKRIIILFLIGYSHCVVAQDTLLQLQQDAIIQTKKSIKKRGSMLKRFIKSFDDYDTTYITPNYYNYAAMMQSTIGFDYYKLEGTNEKEQTQSISLNSSPTIKIGPYFGWRWIFLGYTFDVGRTYTSRKKSEFNLSLYSSMLGCDVVYKTNEGNFNISNLTGFDKKATQQVKGQQFDGLNTYLTSLNVYYIFNHKHFSYPAAFSQSTVQRKSCGSWKLGFNYAHQKISFDYTKLPLSLSGTDGTENWLNNELKFKKINYYDYSINFGYAYNWVFSRNSLLSISLSPAIGYKYTNAEKPNVQDAINYNINNLNFDLIARIGLVWNNTKYFGGISFILHSYSYKKDRFSVNNTFGYLSMYAGLNFKRKRQYR
ncbi:MAG: DUF4421 domain-containing protein [Bacteroidaceae bacterium]